METAMRWSELRPGMLVKIDAQRVQRFVIFSSPNNHDFEIRALDGIGEIIILSIERRNKDYTHLGISGRQVLCGMQRDGSLFAIGTTFHNGDDWNLIA